MAHCGNCDWWSQSEVVSRSDKSSTTIKKCIARRKKIASDSESCRYFKPHIFYCEQNNCRLTYEQCIARRRNSKNLVDYQNCKRCRQFDKEIRDIVLQYYVDMVPTVTPRHLLVRGESDIANASGPVGSGKIKRRQKSSSESANSKRKIKRREKPNGEDKKRTIKRRSKAKPQENTGLEYSICPKCGQKGMREDYCRVCAYRADLEMTPKMQAIKDNYLNKRKIKRRVKK